jgi:hypothetical protein
MSKKPNFDIDVAHRYFSAECFNRAWDLVEKPSRTPEEDEQMIRLAFASHWHWTEREDCTKANVSVSYWQTSRIHAILGQVENARRYGQLCLQASQGDDIPPFYLGYAYEALARTEAVDGNRRKMEEFVAEARRVAERMPDPDAKKQLLDDLATIKPISGNLPGSRE